jgi:hypothetical protein
VVVAYLEISMLIVQRSALNDLGAITSPLVRVIHSVEAKNTKVAFSTPCESQNVIMALLQGHATPLQCMLPW